MAVDGGAREALHPEATHLPALDRPTPSPRRDGPALETPSDRILRLQRTAGNRAVTRLVREPAGSRTSTPTAAIAPGLESIGAGALAATTGTPDGSSLEGAPSSPIATEPSPPAVPSPPAGPIPPATPPRPPAGNAGVARGARTTRGVQRAPASGGPQAGAAPAHPTTGASYAAFFEGLNDLMIAAVNGGAHLDTTKFGGALTPAHRALLGQFRDALIEAQNPDESSKQHAREVWPALVTKLRAASEDSRRFGISGAIRARAIEIASLVGASNVGAKHAASDQETTSPDALAKSYGQAFTEIVEVLWAFNGVPQAPTDAYLEEVSGRKDAVIPAYVIKQNAEKRDAIRKAKAGTSVIPRHATLLDALRTTLIAAVNEKQGSAYEAFQGWPRIAADVLGVLQRTKDLGLVQSNTVEVAKANSVWPEIKAKWTRVHQDQLRLTLSEPRTAEDAKARQYQERRIQFDPSENTKAVAQKREADAVKDFAHAMSVIEHDLKPSPDYPGEWVLTAPGQQPQRLRAEQGQALRVAAETQLKAYIDEIARGILDVWAHYAGIKQENAAWKLHVLGGWGGADDPGDPEHFVDSVYAVRKNQVMPAIAAGRYSEAFQKILNQKGVFERVAQEVGDYDRDLDVGYSRLSTCVNGIKNALLVATAVAAPLDAAAVIAENGLATTTAATVLAGGGSTAAAETSRELVAGHGSFTDRVSQLQPGKIASVAGQGAAIGLAPVAPGLNKAVGGGVSSALGTSEAFGDFTAATLMSGGQSKLSGGDFTTGALTGSLGWGAGQATKALPTALQSGVPGKAVQATVGAGVGYATSGGDAMAALTSGVGTFAGSFAGPPGAAATPTASGGATEERPAAGAGLGGGADVGGATAPPATESAVPSLPGASTIPGTGIQPRPPAAPTPSSGVETTPGTGIQPRPPAPAAPPAPGAATTPGTGIEPRPPAATAPSTAGASTAAAGATTGTPLVETGAESVPGHDVGSADTAAPKSLGEASTPAAAAPGGHASSMVSDFEAPSGPPKGRDLLPGAQVPENLPATDRPALDFAKGPRQEIDRRGELAGGRSAKPSSPTAAYPDEEAGRYTDTGDKPVAGISGVKSSIVIDRQTGKKYLFKPTEAEHRVPRAVKRGILKGEQAPREVAGSMVAGELGIASPESRLATIGGKEGVLIEWQEKNTLRDLALADKEAFLRLTGSEQFRDAMTSMDALDYLTNNLDRGMNLGNYLYEFSGGQLKLTAIDHGLTFTSTPQRADVAPFTRGLPEKYPPELVEKLEALEAKRAEVVNALRPLVGDAAATGFDQRLTQLLADMRAKNSGRP